MSRRLLFGTTTIMLLTIATRSRADVPAGLELRWNAPPQCPRAEEVTREVDRLLGGTSQAHALARRVSARADVSQTAQGWRVVLATERDGIGGKRTLEARSCEALAHATAIVLALTLDPAHAASAAGSSPSPDGSPTGGRGAEPDATPATEAPPAAPADPRAREAPLPLPPPSEDRGESVGAPARGPRFSLGAGAAGDVGVLPGVAFAPEVSVAWLPERLRVELAFAYFPRVTALVDPSRGGEIAVAAATVRGCRVWVLGAFELGPCLAFEGGVMTGDGIGIRFPGSGRAPWLSVDGGAIAAMRLASSPVWLVARLGAEIPLTRYEFQVDGVGIVHQPSPVAGRASFGGEVRF